ncbi:hypothetical protein N9E03_01235 [bacterium]|nr:hypothetical protein [bacterium]
MRLDHLVEKDLPADAILKEIGVPKEERQVIMEFLPLIPVALWAGGAAWTAYDTYQAKKALDAGEITQAEFATRVGTDVAIGVAGGVLGKVAGKGFKVGKEIYKSKKAARAAQKKTADIPTPKDAAVPPTGINVVANATTTTAKTSTKKAVQTAKPGDTIKTDKGEFLAGVDGKATTTRINAPNAAEIKKQILKISDTPASSAATVVTTKSVSKTLDKLAGKVDPALQKAADAAKSVATKTVDKTKDLAKDVATKTVDKVKKIGSKTTSYTGGDDIARNYVRNNAKDRMKDLDPIGKKAFVKSIEKAHPGIAKELNLDKLIAPTAAVTSKAVSKQTTKKLTRKQQNALSNMGTPAAAVTSKAANKTVKNQLTKQQRDALSNMGTPAASVTSKAAAKQTTQKLTKKQRDALSNMGTPAAAVTSKAAAKQTTQKLTKQQQNALSNMKTPAAAVTSKAANKTVNKLNKTNKVEKPKKKKGKLKTYISNLNKGNYWDTNLSGVVSKFNTF